MPSRPRSTTTVSWTTLWFFALGCTNFGHAQSGYFGAAEVNIDPTTPIMLSGYAGRAGGPEATVIQQSIYAKAAAFGTGDDTALLLTVDITGFPRNVTDEVASRLESAYGIPRERVVITCTHSHNCPHCTGYLDNIFSTAGGLTPSQQQRVDQYTADLIDKLEAVAIQALDNRAPGHQMQRGQGSVGFAANRRTAGGPVDHDLPVLRVVDSNGDTKSIITSYASHAVTLSSNQVSGDWPGYAQQYIEDAYPGAIAMVMIGAGADANPSPMGATSYAQNQGQAIADEVQRVLAETTLAPVAFGVNAQSTYMNLDHATSLQPGDPGSARLAPAPAQLNYGLTSWSFGDDLAMVFMEGEVVVDYALRLKSELGDDRLWVNAYANAVPGYIPSERILYEGGYEADDSTFWYALPGRLAHGLEDQIVGAVQSQLGPFFNPQDRLTLTVDAATGEVTIRNDWSDPLTMDAYTVVSEAANLRPQSGAWNSLADRQESGWNEAGTSTATRVTEFNPTSGLTLAPGDFVSLGFLHQVIAPAAFGEPIPAIDDLSFRYSTTGTESIEGIVSLSTDTENTNNLVLTIDPATGEVTIQNESAYFNASIDAYTIVSNLGALQVDDWASLAEQGLADWDEADNSNAFRVTEFNPDGELLLGGQGQILHLGSLVDVTSETPDVSDFEFRFTLADGTEVEGVIVIGSLPTMGLPGDVNFDGVVDIFDINVISDNWNTAGPRGDANHDGIVDIFDVNTVSDHWGASSLAAVPEPATAWLFGGAISCLLVRVVGRRARGHCGRGRRRLAAKPA